MPVSLPTQPPSTSPKRVLFYGFPAHGHVNPSMPLVREVVSRGIEVTYLANDRYKEPIQSSGATYRSYQTPFLANLDWKAPPPEFFGTLIQTARQMLGDGSDMSGERPDAVIYDAMSLWGCVAGRRWGCPTIGFSASLALNEDVLAYAWPEKAALGETCPIERARRAKVRQEALTAFGPELAEAYENGGDLWLVNTTRALQPRAETFDPRYTFIGPLTGDAGEPRSLMEIPDDGRPVVYVSLGTIYNRDAAFFRTCLEALADMEVYVVLATGDGVPVAALEPHPENAIVRRFVPQCSVLRRASAFVSRGGLGSVTSALLAHTPVLIVPSLPEHWALGRRLQSAGAGALLPRDRVTTHTIRAAVRALLGDATDTAKGRALLATSYQPARASADAINSLLSPNRAAAAGAGRALARSGRARERRSAGG